MACRQWKAKALPGWFATPTQPSRKGAGEERLTATEPVAKHHTPRREVAARHLSWTLGGAAEADAGFGRGAPGSAPTSCHRLPVGSQIHRLVTRLGLSPAGASTGRRHSHFSSNGAK